MFQCAVVGYSMLCLCVGKWDCECLIERCEMLWYGLVCCGWVQYGVFVCEDKWDCECKSERCEMLWCAALRRASCVVLW